MTGDTGGATPSRTGLLLISRGNTDPVGREAALALAERIRQASPDHVVAHGFMTYLAPTVPGAFAELVAGGATEVVAVPMFAHTERMVTSSIPRAMLWMRRRHPHVPIRAAPNLGLVPGVEEVVLRAASDAAELSSRKMPEDKADWKRRGWRTKPFTRERRAFICTSTYCTEVGATDMLAKVKAQLAAAGYADYEPRPSDLNIQATRSACLSLCGIAPVMVVYPEGTWYGRFDEQQLERIVDEHLIGGCPVKELALPPRSVSD
jgi:(2Fe-2S) ferredoxin/sirohydrochlorin ferrochelatase